MKSRNILYPWPVLSSFHDDLIDSSFNLTTKENPNLKDGSYEISLKIILENEELLLLFKNKKVKIVVTAESKKSYYFKKSEIINLDEVLKISIPYLDVDSNTIITAYVVTSLENLSYRNESFNTDYLNRNFILKNGSIIAISNSIVMKTIQDPVEVSSIFTVQSNLEKNDLDYSVDIENDERIVISLSKENKKLFTALYIGNKELIYGLIIVPVLTEVIMLVLDDYDKYSQKRWFHSLDISLKEENIFIEEYIGNISDTGDLIEKSRECAWRVMKTELGDCLDTWIAELQNDVEE